MNTPQPLSPSRKPLFTNDHYPSKPSVSNPSLISLMNNGDDITKFDSDIIPTYNYTSESPCIKPYVEPPKTIAEMKEEDEDKFLEDFLHNGQELLSRTKDIPYKLMCQEPKSKRALYEQHEDYEDSAGDNTDEWECPACTYLNPSSQKICDICGTNRPSRRSVGASDSEWRSKLHVGSVIDAQDMRGQWYKSIIINEKDNKFVVVHFLGWKSDCDELISLDSPRLARLTSHLNEYAPLFDSMGYELNNGCRRLSSLLTLSKQRFNRNSLSKQLQQQQQFVLDATVYMKLPFQNTLKYYIGKIIKVHNKELVDIEIEKMKLSYVKTSNLKLVVPKGEEIAPQDVKVINNLLFKQNIGVSSNNNNIHIINNARRRESVNLNMMSNKNKPKRYLFNGNSEVNTILNEFVSEFRPYNSSLFSKGQTNNSSSSSNNNNNNLSSGDREIGSSSSANLLRYENFFQNILAISNGGLSNVDDELTFHHAPFEYEPYEDRDWINDLDVGNMIDYKSKENIWYEATIIDINESGMKIKYNNDKEEWVNKESNRITVHGYHRNKYGQKEERCAAQ